MHKRTITLPTYILLIHIAAIVHHKPQHIDILLSNSNVNACLPTGWYVHVDLLFGQRVQQLATHPVIAILQCMKQRNVAILVQYGGVSVAFYFTSNRSHRVHHQSTFLWT